MDTDRDLEEVAAKIDDLTEAVEEIQDHTVERGAPREKPLDRLHEDLERAADAVDEAVDPDHHQ